MDFSKRKKGTRRQILTKIPNNKFYTNPLVGVAVTLRTDRQTEIRH